MELRHIRYFLAVAREGNFTRAAERLGIGQPPLSMQIKDLEREVGAALFYRRPHGAELTEAGQAFLDGVGGMPARADEAADAARRAARGEGGRLAIGMTSTAALNPIVPDGIRRFGQLYPDVALRIEEANSLELVRHIDEGQLDVAVVRPAGLDRPSLTLRTVIDERLMAALPEGHELASHSTLRLIDLRNDPLILTPREVGRGLRDVTLDLCREAGFEPRIGREAPHIASILSLVSAALGVTLMPESMSCIRLAGVVYRPLADAHAGIPLAVAYAAQRTPPTALNFWKLLRR